MFLGTQRLSFPLTSVMYVLDVEYGMIVQAYFLPSDPQRGSDELTDKASYPT